MKLKWEVLALIALGAAAVVGQVPAATNYGANTGVAATGTPIIVGCIYANGASGDWSSSTYSATAEIACVNGNCGIKGRPIEYHLENDQWALEAAARTAAKLVNDNKAVALVGNGSFIEMAVNAKIFAGAGIMVMASDCAISKCFESSNIVSTNQGPLQSNLGAAQYAQEELGAKNFARIGLNLPAGLAIAAPKPAQKQYLRDACNWISPIPMYDLSVSAALGDHWDSKVFINAVLAPISVNGPDAQNWHAVLEAFGKTDDPRDTFGQSGYLAAKFLVKAMLAMHPANLDDRAKVTAAIKGISGYTFDLMCGLHHVGDADFHLPNHAGYMVKMVGGGFEFVRDYHEFDSPYFDRHIALEKSLGLRKALLDRASQN